MYLRSLVGFDGSSGVDWSLLCIGSLLLRWFGVVYDFCILFKVSVGGWLIVLVFIVFICVLFNCLEIVGLIAFVFAAVAFVWF